MQRLKDTLTPHPSEGKRVKTPSSRMKDVANALTPHPTEVKRDKGTGTSGTKAKTVAGAPTGIAPPPVPHTSHRISQRPAHATNNKASTSSIQSLPSLPSLPSNNVLRNSVSVPGQTPAPSASASSNSLSLYAQMDMKRVRGLVEQKTGNTPNNYLNELVYLKQRFNYATSSLQDEDEGCVRS